MAWGELARDALAILKGIFSRKRQRREELVSATAELHAAMGRAVPGAADAATRWQRTPPPLIDRVDRAIRDVVQLAATDPDRKLRKAGRRLRALIYDTIQVLEDPKASSRRQASESGDHLAQALSEIESRVDRLLSPIRLRRRK